MFQNLQLLKKNFLVPYLQWIPTSKLEIENFFGILIFILTCQMWISIFEVLSRLINFKASLF